MLKITNLSKSIRKLIDGGKWVFVKPKESVLMERIDKSQEFIIGSELFKIEEVKKGKGED